MPTIIDNIRKLYKSIIMVLFAVSYPDFQQPDANVIISMNGHFD